MNLLSLALLSLALSGCADPGDTGGKPKDSGHQPNDSDESPADADGDGHVDVAAGGDDCDDADATVYPGASDAAVDGTDQDCDGFDGPDADADGYADAAAGGEDCDDANAAIHPSAPEACNEVDDDCDTLVDADDPDLTDGYSGYTDGDGDGYGSATPAISCEPDGVVASSTDCDDADAAIHPGAADFAVDGRDQDCDGVDGPDSDGDGYADAARGGEDCDDADATVSPGAPDAAVDGTDQDCDGFDGPDADGDGYADAVAGGEDCDDTNAAIHPSAPEVCNGVDDDCNGAIDEDSSIDAATWFLDGDGDTYGDAAVSLRACAAPAGYIADDTDCDDADATVHPGAPDAAVDGTDQDCDGFDGPDADGDGYADAAGGGEDCGDANAAIHPSAPEACNGVDDDCDGALDEDSSIDAAAWFLDADGDTYGDAAVSLRACAAPAGYVADHTDCDDSDATAYPSAPDAAVDCTDQDCDGFDGPDADADGYADAAAGGGDCDDTDPAVNPGADDVPGSDRNCDGVVSVGSLADVSFKFVAENAGDYAGISVSTAGDVDGDGLADLLVGADGNDSSAGATYVVLGSSLGASRTIDLSAADYKLVGEDAGDYAGHSVSAAGDVDGDGLADLLVGAYGDDDGGSDAGAAYVVLGSSLGSSRTIDLSAADYKLVGEDASGEAGVSVSNAGDVDGDGLDDLLVGAWGDADGGSGTLGPAGAAYVVLGSSLGSSRTIDLSTADYKLVGEGAGDFAGESVSAAGDVDGDGLADLLVGADGDDDGGTEAGAAYTVLGSSLGASRTIDLSAADYKLVGESFGDSAGDSVSSAGDVDGDGLADLLVGARVDDGGSNAGAACVVLGSSLGASRTIDLSAANYMLVGEGAGDYAGSSVSSAGDVDGDGLADLLVGAYGDDDGGDSAGAAYVVLGSSLGSSPTIDLSAANYKLVGESASDDASHVSSAGDVDGDGLDDLLVGAYGDDDGGTDAGAAYLVLSAEMVYPDAPGAVVDGNDQDCGTVDGPDADGDGYADAAAGGADCDDGEATVHPGAAESCNGVDDDCDGALDEDSSIDAAAWFLDGDGDTYGDAAVSRRACAAPAGYVADDTDCDDSDATVYPGTDDTGADGTDQDCDGVDGPDADGDGYADAAVGGEDCDDTDPAVNPGADDVPGSDRNCDGVVFPGDLADASFKFVGEDGGDYAGISVSSAGDLDGDGLADLLVGAYGDDGGGHYAGAAYVVLASSLGSSRTIDLSAADYKLVGESSLDYAGLSVSSAGDVDGDGLADLLVGAYGDDGGGGEAGAAYVVLGSSLGASRTIDLSAANYKLVGEDQYDNAGWSVSSAGDVDGDGLGDLLVGARGDDSDAGAAYVVLGSSLGASRTIDLSAADYKLVGEDSADFAGDSVSSAGDVDGDGLDDLLVGANGDNDGGYGAGAAYVVLGSSLVSSRTIDLSTADYKLVGEDESDHAGWSVSSAGDVDGDGLADLLVGAYGDDDGGTDAGAAYVVLGSSLGSSRTIDLSVADYELVGEDNDYAGISVSSAGDVDGDGLDDLLVGADGDDDGGDGAGAAYMVLGSSLGASRSIDLSAANYKLVGEDESDCAGRSVSSAGDVNGDGRDDLLVGAWGVYDGDDFVGAAYLLVGG